MSNTPHRHRLWLHSWRAAVLLMTVLLGGCGHILYRTYDYETAIVELAAGTLYVETLTITYAQNAEAKVREQRGPYNFRIFFLTDDPPGESIEVEVLNLDALGEGADFFVLENTTRRDTFSATQPPTTTTGHISLIAGVTTNHEPVNLRIAVTYKGRTETVNVDLVPRYSERMRGGIGDLIRSV